MHLDVCLIIGMCARRFGLGFTHDTIYIFACHIFMHISCIHILFFLFIYLWLCSLSFSLSPSLSQIDYIWHLSANHKSTLAKNPLGSRSSSSDPPVLPLHVMGRPNKTSLRTFRNVAFIWSTMLFCRIFQTLFSLWLFELRAGNLFVRYPWGVSSCLYRSFTPTYTASIPLYLISPWHFEVHVS